MPLRSFNREQVWLLLPTLGELIPEDHNVRFVAEFVDGLDREAWIELEIGLDGEASHHHEISQSIHVSGGVRLYSNEVKSGITIGGRSRVDFASHVFLNRVSRVRVAPGVQQSLISLTRSPLTSL